MTSRRELKNYAKQAMSGKYGILILAFVAVQALALISSMISSALFPGEETIDIVLSYAFTFILTLLINVVAAGMNYMYLNIARGKAYSLNDLFYFYRHHPDRVIVAGFFISFFGGSRVDNVSMVFGGLRAVSNLSMHIDEGELIGLIGPNGAGKTTAFNMITGVYTPTEGKVYFNGQQSSGKKSYQVTQMGMARTFQNIRLFSELSVIDNVKIAYNMHVTYNLADAIVRDGKYLSEEEFITQKAMDLLKIFHLEEEAHEVAKNLPYGKQRRLEIARALATEPKLLLLDEPAAGMNPQETKELMEMIRWIRKEFHLSILLIEHDMGLVMGVCERIYVLEYGMKIAEGTPDEIKHNKRVIEAYLGEEVIN